MPTVTTTNQQPSVLTSFYVDDLQSNFDPFAIIKDQMVSPLYRPLLPGIPIHIDVDGKTFTPDDASSLLMQCSDERVDADAELLAKELFKQTLVDYDESLPVQDIYATQNAKKHKLLLPSPRVIYTENDVITTAKHFLANQATKEEFFATTSFYCRVAAFGYYFANNTAWSQFKTWFMEEVNQILSNLDVDTVNLCNDLQNITLTQLTESFSIRGDSSQNNDPYSFARLFPAMLLKYEQYVKSNNLPDFTAGHMPFTFGENLCPNTIIIMNVEKHAHAHPSEIKQEWQIIKNALAIRPKTISLNQIQRLTALTRMAKKMQSAAAATSLNMAYKSGAIKFRKTAPTSVDLYKYIEKIYKHAQFVQKSENVVKMKKLTYQRPNRRCPDDPNKPGKINRQAYKPDLHIYLDCSGSISERDYQDAIKSCILLAKKLNINFFFNSFSDKMSECTKLHLEGKSPKQIYENFRKIPKVSGGTDYEQIWHYINQSAKRGMEVSIIITDMEYTAPNHYVKHPRHLFYAPISTHSWPILCRDAEDFAKSMFGICPDIRKRMLM